MDRNERAIAIGAALARLNADQKRACAEIAEALAFNPVTATASGLEVLRAFAATLRDSADGKIGQQSQGGQP